jgi:Xaa-Pro aminopeptidase
LGINRLQKLRQVLAQQGFDALLVSQPENRYYLSSFSGSDGWLLINSGSALLAVDFRYTEQAKIESPLFEIVHVKGDAADLLPKIAADLGINRLGFEAADITFTTYRKLSDALASVKTEIKLVPSTNLIESIRIIKEPEELEHISQAAALADSAITYISSIIHPGMTEKQVAWELEKHMREKGSGSMPFTIIVGSGPNAAMPHASQSERTVLQNEPIVIDLGARANGYCSDLTRTLYLGEPDSTFCKIYDITLGAQLSALELIESGMTGENADKIARNIIEQAAYGDSFGHGLGHGIGLATHELPRLGPRSNDLLADGMVFSVEPGIYIPGWGGVRIEDTVVLENNKVRALTKAPK